MTEVKEFEEFNTAIIGYGKAEPDAGSKERNTSLESNSLYL